MGRASRTRKLEAQIAPKTSGQLFLIRGWGLKLAQESREQRERPQHNINDAEHLGRHSQPSLVLGHTVNIDCFDCFVGFAKSEKAQNKAEAEDPYDAHDQSIFGIACR